jgi:5-methylcytosine-specific restriction endonuclease McrA
VKLIDEFSFNKSKKDGRQAYCKECCQGLNRISNAKYQKTESVKKSKRLYRRNHYKAMTKAERTEFNKRGNFTFKMKPIVLKRDNNQCQLCNTGNNLEVHHILPVKQFPALTYDITNIVILCHDCHTFKAHLNGNIKKFDLEIAKQLQEKVKENIANQEVEQCA